MTRWMVSIVLAAAACVGPTSAPHSMARWLATAESICDLMSAPENRVGALLLITGLYVATPHGGQIYGRECPDRPLQLRGSVQLRSDPQAEAVLSEALRKRSSARVPVVYRGVLMARQFVSCPERACFEYSLEQAQLLHAELPQ